MKNSTNRSKSFWTVILVALTVVAVIAFALVASYVLEDHEDAKASIHYDMGETQYCNEIASKGNTIKLGSFDLKYYDSELDCMVGDGVKEELEWEIVKFSKDGKHALVICKNLVNKMPYYDEELWSVTWEKSLVRKWLNEDFIFEAFSDKDRELIQPVSLVNEDNETWGSDGGDRTEDSIFLLSLSEARECRNNTSDSMVARYVDGGADIWWLRTPGAFNLRSSAVEYNGSLYLSDFGQNVTKPYGVRPAFWVNLTQDVIESNDIIIP